MVSRAFRRDHHHPSVTDAAFGDDVVGEVLDVPARSLHRRDFEAGRIIQMDVHGRNRDVVVLMRTLDQPVRQIARGMIVNIDQRSDAVVGACAFLPHLRQTVTREITDDLGAVLIAAFGCCSVDLFEQVVVEGDGDALHEVLRCGVQSGECNGSISHCLTVPCQRARVAAYGFRAYLSEHDDCQTTLDI